MQAYVLSSKPGQMNQKSNVILRTPPKKSGKGLSDLQTDWNRKRQKVEPGKTTRIHGLCYLQVLGSSYVWLWRSWLWCDVAFIKWFWSEKMAGTSKQLKPSETFSFYLFTFCINDKKFFALLKENKELISYWSPQLWESGLIEKYKFSSCNYNIVVVFMCIHLVIKIFPNRTWRSISKKQDLTKLFKGLCVNGNRCVWLEVWRVWIGICCLCLVGHVMWLEFSGGLGIMGNVFCV